MAEHPFDRFRRVRGLAVPEAPAPATAVQEAEALPLTPLELFQMLHARGVRLRPFPDGTLQCQAPDGAWTPALRQAFQTQYGALHALVETFEERAAVTEPLSERSLAVGDWVLLLSANGIQQNPTPYRVKAIEQGSDGHSYARFAETSTGWRIDRCEKVESLTPGEAFDALFEGMQAQAEEAQMRQYFPPPEKAPGGSPALLPASPALGLPLNGPGAMQVCPRCGCPDLMDGVTYRKCPLCSWKDGPTAQEILEQQ